MAKARARGKTLTDELSPLKSKVASHESELPRLEQNATGGEILLSDATAQAARHIFPFKQREPLTVKNRVQPVPIYEVEWQQTDSAADE